MFRFINKESKTIIGAATIVGVLSFASRLIGLIRDRILAGTFGAGDTLDAYYAAFKFPDLMFGLLVVGSLSACFIPLFAKHFYHPLQKEQAWKFTNNTLHLVGTAVIIVSLFLAIFARPFAEIIAPGFTFEKQVLVIAFFRIMLLAQILLAFSVIFGSVLQSMKRFLLYALSPVLYNVGIIIGAVWFVNWFGPLGLGWGVVFGAFLHLIVQLYGVISSGYRYKWSFSFQDKDTKEMFKLTGPRMIGIAMNQILFVLLTIIATTLSVGSVTIFQFAYNIQFFPVGIIGVSYAIAAFPSFSEYIEKGDEKQFIRLFSSTVRQILFFLVPLMILFLILRAQIVRVVVGAGSFDWDATILTANTLGFFALTFIPQSLVYLLARAFFAKHDTMTPMTAGIIATFFGVISAFWLKGHFGVVGLGIAYSLASIVNIALLWVPLREKFGSLDELRIIQSLFKISVAGMVCAVVMQLIKPVVVSVISLETFFGVFSQGFVAGIFGLISYILIMFLLRSEELESFLSGMRRKVFKSYKPEEPVSL